MIIPFLFFLIVVTMNDVAKSEGNVDVAGKLLKSFKEEILREMDAKLKALFTREANDTSELEERVEILEAAMIVVQEDLSEAQAEIDDLENEDALINIQLVEIETDVFNNENDIEELHQRVDVVDALLANNTEETRMLQERISTVEETVNAPWTACDSSPCDNGATCVNVNVDTFICVCRDGFFGTTCSESYSETVFLATFEEVTVFVSTPIVFDEVRINSGGHYNNTTGIYTVPTNGIYELYVHIYNGNATANPWAFYILVDGTRMTDSAHYMQSEVATADNVSISALVQLELVEGQEISVEPHQLVSIIGTQNSDSRMCSWFSGHLIMPA